VAGTPGARAIFSLFVKTHLLRVTAAAIAFVVVAGGAFIPQKAEAQISPLSAGQWCSVVRPDLEADSKRAEQVMNGIVDLGKFGSYALPKDPDWTHQRTADLSGNREMHSLNWLMPLLRHGSAVKSDPMLARARTIIWDWVSTYPVTRRSSPSDWPLISGKRIIALNCAAAILEDPVVQGIADAEAGRIAALRQSWVRPNNTSIMGYTGLLFHACVHNNEALRNESMSAINRLARILVNDDGSDTEGSPAYANFTLKLFRDAAEVMKTCNVSTDFVDARTSRMEQFLARTIRPNFMWDTIGDSTAERLSPTVVAPTSPLFWAATRGRQGVAPGETYSIYRNGGYIFGRSGWTPASTYYSLRAVPAGARSAHSHLDSTSFTMMSQGVQWIGDPGPYRYDTSALRKFITKRAAHSGLQVLGIKGGTRGAITIAENTGDVDRTCVRDVTFKPTVMVRCVTYTRSTDTFVITDRFEDPRKPKSSEITFVQRWQLPPGVSALPLASGQAGFQLLSGTGGVQMIADPQANFSYTLAKAGGVESWFTTSYGQIAAGSTITRRVKSRGASEHLFTTVIAPGVAPIEPVVDQP
jgi:hypothetical protein